MKVGALVCIGIVLGVLAVVVTCTYLVLRYIEKMMEENG